jgi:hypothetical protein
MIIFLFKVIFWFIGLGAIFLLCAGIYENTMKALEHAFITRQIDHVLYTIKAKELFQFLLILFIMLLSLLTYLITQLN